jgi:8-oxo-dGTP pyrophosphatase MutT (NUDIX family)
VVAYFVYLVATTHIFINNKKELRLWIPRRSRNKATWPGTLDTAVAGALVVGERSFECMLREAEEEASLPVSMVREQVRDCGQVVYFSLSDGKKETGRGEEGLYQPECGVMYEIELEEGAVPKPREGEVEGFYCWSVEEVREALGRGEFKTNSAGVMVDWLRRHGLLGEGSEGKVEGEIERRLRRELEFPLM